MTMRWLFILCVSTLGLAAAGCESIEDPSVPVMPDPRLTPAARLPDDSDSTMPRVIEVKVPVPSPQLRPIESGGAPQPAFSGSAAVAAAKAGATTKPATDEFLNAIQYYDYAPGTVYTANSRHAPWVAGIPSLQHGQCLWAANFPDDDPIRAQPQCHAQQIRH